MTVEMLCFRMLMQPVAINYMLLMPIEVEDVDVAAGGDVDLYV